jgi:NAD(P)-dependent dehydrogenase (short-subunit alcohol dehydrogenase family)
MGLLDGKVAIVTGAGHGIGRGEALELAKEGAKVVVNDVGGSVSGEGADKRVAETVAEVIRERGGEAVANYDDIADWNGAKNLVDQAVESFGKLDILVNNAGILRDKMIFSMTEDDFDSVVRVHLKGTFACTHHAAVYWREQSKAGNQPRAAIVNTVSSAGLQGNVGQANYGSAKAGIAAMTIIASLELGRLGVRANAVAPGGVTRMSSGVVKDLEVKEADEYGDEEYERLNPGNSAPMVAWLASDEALHVTGQVFRAVGHTITRYIPWTLGAEIETKGGPGKWNPADIGAAVNATIFGSRNPGLQLGGR